MKAILGLAVTTLVTVDTAAYSRTRPIYLSKEELKAQCERRGGKFSTDASGAYYCKAEGRTIGCLDYYGCVAWHQNPAQPTSKDYTFAADLNIHVTYSREEARAKFPQIYKAVQSATRVIERRTP